MTEVIQRVEVHAPGGDGDHKMVAPSSPSDSGLVVLSALFYLLPLYMYFIYLHIYIYIPLYIYIDYKKFKKKSYIVINYNFS